MTAGGTRRVSAFYSVALRNLNASTGLSNSEKPTRKGNEHGNQAENMD
jgi:hypothetical protein